MPDFVSKCWGISGVERNHGAKHTGDKGIDSTRRKFDNNCYENPTGSDGVIFDLDTFSKRIISSAKVTEIPRVISKVKVHNIPGARTSESKNSHTDVSPEDLSEPWHIGVGQARETLKRTYQKFVRSSVTPLYRRYKSNKLFHKTRLCGKWPSDTMDGRVKLLDDNIYAQVFVNKIMFAAVYPMDSKSKAGDALHTFVNEHGIPADLIFNGSK